MARELNLADRVREILRSNLSNPSFGVNDIARLFGLKPWRLQGLLGKENTSVSELKNKTRRELTILRLRDGEDPIGVIAKNLGYSNRLILHGPCAVGPACHHRLFVLKIASRSTQVCNCTRPADMHFELSEWDGKMSMLKNSCKHFFPFLSLMVFGCASGPPLFIELMPSPAIFEDGQLDPFPIAGSEKRSKNAEIFYVTDRARAEPEDEERFYVAKRGHLLRVGTADIGLDPDLSNWNDVRRISFATKRDREYKLEVNDVHEIGVLPESLSVLHTESAAAETSAAARDEFVKQVDHQLHLSRSDDIYIYVHGYKVNFENPLLVATELYHFLGYEGAAIAYSWPSTPKRLAYFKDIETTGATARNLRILLEVLSQRTSARKIHLVAYSAGTRVVFDTISQLSLLRKQAGPNSPAAMVPIGNVILVGSDIDRTQFASGIIDGLLDVPDRLTVYQSSEDDALGISKFLFARERLGEKWKEGEIGPEIEQKLANLENLTFIDISKAEDFDAGNGHGYFRSSPWASSDILSTLLLNLSPSERGLVREPGKPSWQFPPDYIEKLSAALAARGVSSRSRYTKLH